MKKVLLYILNIIINGALALGSLYIGSKAWYVFTHADGILDFFKYCGLYVVYLILITILVKKKV